jgi:hypothetical protein
MASFHFLTDDVLLHILGLLPAKDILNCSMVGLFVHGLPQNGLIFGRYRPRGDFTR